MQLSKFVYRNISDAAILDRVLATRPKFVSLGEALAGGGDALTIDDATTASADAALLARKHGHAVTLFVNPGQIESGQTYSFLLMSVLLDQLTLRTVNLDGETFPFTNGKQKNALRERLKVRLRDMPGETDRIAWVRELATMWSAGSLRVPDYLKTITFDDLKSLIDSGVDIQNHGWLHDCHRRLSAPESASAISAGREWLRGNLKVDARYFAVPFGDVMPPENVGLDCDCWLTVDDRLPPGKVDDEVWNRVTLEAPPRLGPVDQLKKRARRFARITRKRFPLLGARSSLK